MLYHLFHLLSADYSVLNVFRYITFRAMMAFLLSFVFVLIIQPKFIRWVRCAYSGQPIREEGPKTHASKAGTPTMGGAVVVLAIFLSTLLLCDLSNRYVWIALFVMLSLAVLGYVDDVKKLKEKKSDGVRGRHKLIIQAVIGIAAGLWLYLIGFPTDLRVPFLKEVSLEMGFFFPVFCGLVIVATSNAVNLTDGLDGLAIGPIMTVGATYAIFAYLGGHAVLANYLGIPYISGAGELTIVLSAVFASGLGFLWFNTSPAQVFMGDIGALSLGGLLGLIAVIVKQELVLIIAGGVFVVEAISVILQVFSFKLTGKRIFNMAPLHHHFEMKGLHETKIVVRFWIVSILLAILALTTLKLR